MRKQLFYLIVAFAVVLVIGATAALVVAERDRKLPNQVSIGGLSLAGMTWEQALIPVESLLDKMEKHKYRLVTDQGVAEVFQPEELGISYDSTRTLAQIFNDTSWFSRLFEGAEANQVQERQYKPFAVIDHRQLREVVQDFLYEQENDYHNAWMAWNDNQWSIGEARDARILKEGEIDRVREQIVQWSTDLSEDERRITVTYDTVPAEIQTEDLQELHDQIQGLIAEPLVFRYDGEEYEYSLSESPHWFDIDVREQKYRFNIDFAQEWVEEYAALRDQEKGQVVVTELKDEPSEYDGKTYQRAVFEGAFTHGRKIDRDSVLQGIVKAFSDPEADREVTVAWEDIPPRVHSLVEGYQFPQLLSTGISSFRLGNHPNRVRNIELSLGAFQGVVVEPGEELSFNRVTGWITPRKGYTWTKVIMEGRVEEGVGGGVCQSSTTFYRSILNAGLPVTERRNHSLDINYYHAYGYGLDATVYTDSRNDLRFVNDFDEPILINTFVDNDKDLAYVEFYGVTDGREVILTEIPTGNYLLKKWEWKIVWPEREEIRSVISRYNLPKEEEEEEVNPLEA